MKDTRELLNNLHYYTRQNVHIKSFFLQSIIILLFLVIQFKNMLQRKKYFYV